MNTRPVIRSARRAFSMVEALIALAITALLMTATLSALDASYKGFRHTSESASSNVITRIVMQRLTAMIRTGTDFGPYPANPILNPVLGDDPAEGDGRMEFVVREDPATDTREVVTLERRAGDAETGPFELWYIHTTFQGGAFSSEREERLLENLTELRFILEYDVGPRLRRATIDLVMIPNDLRGELSTDIDTPALRMTASAAPRRQD